MPVKAEWLKVLYISILVFLLLDFNLALGSGELPCLKPYCNFDFKGNEKGDLFLDCYVATIECLDENLTNGTTNEAVAEEVFNVYYDKLRENYSKIRITLSQSNQADQAAGWNKLSEEINMWMKSGKERLDGKVKSALLVSLNNKMASLSESTANFISQKVSTEDVVASPIPTPTTVAVEAPAEMKDVPPEPIKKKVKEVPTWSDQIWANSKYIMTAGGVLIILTLLFLK